MNKKLLFIFLMPLFLLFCESSRADNQENKEWTVLIFMSADNNLSNYALADIQEMESFVETMGNNGSSSEEVNVVVEADFKENTGSFRYYIEQFNKAYSVNNKIQSKLVKRLPEDYGSISARLSSFIKWGREEFPAEKYMVIIWGHGEGFIDSSLYKNFKVKPFGGMAFDNSDGSYLSPKDIFSSIDEKVDIIAFDACLMQSLEVSAAIKDKADYIIASNQVQNYLGLPYRRILDELQRNPLVYEVVQDISQWSEESWQDGGYQNIIDPSGFDTFTISALSSSELKYSIYKKFDQVLLYLQRFLNEDRSRINELKLHLKKAPRFQGGSIDIGLFYGLILEFLWKKRFLYENTSISYTSLMDAVKESEDHLDMAIVSYSYGPFYYTGITAQDYMPGYFAGLSLWFPKTSREYLSRIDEYKKSSFYQELHYWNDFLKLIYEDQFFLLF